MPKNAQTITKFYDTAAKNDFARLFQFRLIEFGNVQFATDSFTYIETTSLPGRTVNNITAPYMGLQFNVPGAASYPGSNAYNVVIRCDQEYKIRQALEAASFDLFDDASTTGNYSIPDGTTTNVLQMALLDKQMNQIRHYTLFGVWVQTVQDVQYDVKDNGVIVTMPVVLSYQFWRSGKTNPTTTYTSDNNDSRTITFNK
jgi:hypothetical protein